MIILLPMYAHFGARQNFHLCDGYGIGTFAEWLTLPQGRQLDTRNHRPTEKLDTNPGPSEAMNPRVPPKMTYQKRMGRTTYPWVSTPHFNSVSLTLCQRKVFFRRCSSDLTPYHEWCISVEASDVAKYLFTSSSSSLILWSDPSSILAKS